MRFDRLLSLVLLFTSPVVVGALTDQPAWSAPNRADWTGQGDQTGAQFGHSVAPAGDVNGDGFGDVIVGAPDFDSGQTDEGRAVLYLGSPSGLATTAAWSADGDQRLALFGDAAGSAGDVNGDGYDDVIVGAPLFDHDQINEGKAYVYLGSPSGPGAVAAWTAQGDQQNAFFGTSVGSAGDVNGDGYDDVIVGAPYYDGGQSDEGRALVYAGSPSGLSSTPVWTGENDLPDSNFGTSVGSAGDVNGDGFGDVIVGASFYGTCLIDVGRAYAYVGSPSGLGTSPAWTAQSDQSTACFGASVGTAGDVNGDGYDDVIVGAPDYANGETEEGRAFVYQGSSSGLSTTPSWTAESDQAFARFGVSVATVGDVDGDGFDDVIVGAFGYDHGQTDEGRSYVYRGSASGLRRRARTGESNQDEANLGGSVGTAGDVNGDGYDDRIVGAEFYDNGQTDEGAAFALYGQA